MLNEKETEKAYMKLGLYASSKSALKAFKNGNLSSDEYIETMQNIIKIYRDKKEA